MSGKVFTLQNRDVKRSYFHIPGCWQTVLAARLMLDSPY